MATSGLIEHITAHTYNVCPRMKQFFSCALVRGRGIVFRHYYKSIAKCAGTDFRDGAVVPFERVWVFSVQYMIVLWGFPLSLPFRV